MVFLNQSVFNYLVIYQNSRGAVYTGKYGVGVWKVWFNLINIAKNL
jgi:hypothetical protein